jgi:hypothetical protein
MQPQLQSQQQQPQQEIVVQLQPQQQQRPLQAVPKQTVHSQSLQPSQGQSQPHPLPQVLKINCTFLFYSLPVSSYNIFTVSVECGNQTSVLLSAR